MEVSEQADVVGYEIDSTSALGKDGRRVFVPPPDTLAVSAEALVVPAAGFGASVVAFRSQHGTGAGA